LRPVRLRASAERRRKTVAERWALTKAFSFAPAFACSINGFRHRNDLAAR
jgi:hypothetical protein